MSISTLQPGAGKGDRVRSVRSSRKAVVPRAAKRKPIDQPSRFDVYRADQVRFTSTLFGGGDWHWRLTAATGAIIADCGGYRSEAACVAAVSAIQCEAGLASILPYR